MSPFLHFGCVNNPDPNCLTLSRLIKMIIDGDFDYNASYIGAVSIFVGLSIWSLYELIVWFTSQHKQTKIHIGNGIAISMWMYLIVNFNSIFSIESYFTRVLLLYVFIVLGSISVVFEWVMIQDYFEKYCSINPSPTFTDDLMIDIDSIAASNPDAETVKIIRKIHGLRLYKGFHPNMNHYGFIYKTGLNILTDPFNLNTSDHCGSGGLYFTTKELIQTFTGFDDHIREVTLPWSNPNLRIRLFYDYFGDIHKMRTNMMIVGDIKYNRTVSTELSQTRTVKVCDTVPIRTTIPKSVTKNIPKPIKPTKSDPFVLAYTQANMKFFRKYIKDTDITFSKLMKKIPSEFHSGLRKKIKALYK
jgi:hypothetical protein